MDSSIPTMSISCKLLLNLEWAFQDYPLHNVIDWHLLLNKTYSNDVQQVQTKLKLINQFCLLWGKKFTFYYAGKMCQKILQRWQLLLPNLSALTESSVKERHMTQSHIPKYWFTSNWVYIKPTFIHQFILVRLEVPYFL